MSRRERLCTRSASPVARAQHTPRSRQLDATSRQQLLFARAVNSAGSASASEAPSRAQSIWRSEDTASPRIHFAGNLEKRRFEAVFVASTSSFLKLPTASKRTFLSARWRQLDKNKIKSFCLFNQTSGKRHFLADTFYRKK